jgi:hypothetical protein
LGGRHVRDEGDDVREQEGDVREQGGALIAPQALAPVPAGRDATVAKSRLVRQQHRRRVIIDQLGASPSPDSYDSPGRWGDGGNWHRDEWHDNDGQRGWNDNRDDDW